MASVALDRHSVLKVFSHLLAEIIKFNKSVEKNKQFKNKHSSVLEERKGLKLA